MVNLYSVALRRKKENIYFIALSLVKTAFNEYFVFIVHFILLWSSSLILCFFMGMWSRECKVNWLYETLSEEFTLSGRSAIKLWPVV